MSEETTSTEAYQFQAEIRQLLHILAHSLYTDREIFLRELISNASDALHRVQFEMLTNRDVRDPEVELAIRVEFDADAKTLTISDSGIGMTREELIQNLGTIAHSGVGTFLRDLQEETPAADIIGQFGVGFYSVFMVADQVRVVSRSYLPEAEAFEWSSSAGDSYTITPADRQARGTSIIIQLKDDAAEYANTWKLEQTVIKHSNYIPFPIYLGDRMVNQQTTLWRQMPSEVDEEKHNTFYQQLTLDSADPLARIHINTDAPVQVYALLYLPSRRDRGPLGPRADYGLRLYTKKVLIQENAKDLLPNHFRFVEGVVDTEELPLNISRETIQSSQAMEKVRRVLESRLLRQLERMASEEPDTYDTFWGEFGVFIKEGVSVDLIGRQKLLPLLRFHASGQADALTSLQAYAERMTEEQEAIYYLLAEDLASAAASPHMDYFRDRGVEVLYLVDPIDSFLVMGLQEYEGKSLRNVDDAGLELPGKSDDQESVAELPSAELDRLKERCVDVLGDRITQVRTARHLKDSPIRLVSPGDVPMREMQRVQRLLNQEFQVPAKILELNGRHPLIVKLAKMVVARRDDPLINLAIEQLYENGLLLEGIHPNPVAMAPRIQALLESAVEGVQLEAP